MKKEEINQNLFFKLILLFLRSFIITTFFNGIYVLIFSKELDFGFYWLHDTAVIVPYLVVTTIESIRIIKEHKRLKMK